MASSVMNLALIRNSDSAIREAARMMTVKAGRFQDVPAAS